MPTRRRAREVVLQLLYEDDLNQDQNKESAEQFLRSRLHNHEALVGFARNLWMSVLQHRREIDQALAARATNWSLRRMAAIDRNILRLGAYELLKTDTPGRVVINEAVELAKSFGNRQSGQFVNGVLDGLHHAHEHPSEDQVAEATKSE